MAYSIEVAELLCRTVRKFCSLNRHQLAGHVANLDFWAAEVKHAAGVLDGFGQRHRQMESAQRHHIAEHDTRQFSKYEAQEHAQYPQEYPLPAAAPDRSPVTAGAVAGARQQLVDAFEAFLQRCCSERLLTPDEADRFFAAAAEASPK